MARQPPLVRVEHLCKTYGTTGLFSRPADKPPAVDDVSFDIAPGETLGLVGHSGSGKTTIGRTMLRLVEPTSGQVTVNLPAGECVDLMALKARDLRAFRRHVQIVFQDPFTSLNPRMTVRDIVGEPLEIHRIVESGGVVDETRRLLEHVGLDTRLLDERPTALSGGQRQRVSIARAIATEPCFIVADEPVTALDVSVQAQILNLMKDLQDRLGLSYLFISHDLAVVEHMADRMAVLSEGRLVEVGETAQILTDPRHPHTQALVKSAARGLA